MSVFKCMGVCSTCGKCKNSMMMNGANDRKVKMIVYPVDFAADQDENGYGVAFDIGTTTVVGMLWDLAAGKQLDACSRTNPQNEFGMDVISRINFCEQEETNTAILQRKIVDCINEIIKELCAGCSVRRQDIRKASICGNTTMSHLFAGYHPHSLARAPFSPAYTGALSMTPEEVGIDIAETGDVWVTPNIAGHVGGDITAGLVATRIFDRNGVTLFIDIGTNGEIVLTDGETALACSTAAGPAFEGASIRHGMRATEGAIEKVMIQEGEVLIKTIGNHEPQGICGSGLIDALAQMLEHKLINKSGRLISAADAEKKRLDAAFQNLLVERDGERVFIIAKKDNGTEIAITQNDIREVQLAKGAISAGIHLMLADLGKCVEDIKKVIVAGAFGNYIDKYSAVRIGLLPDIAPERILSVGNAAGTGVSMVLVSEAERVLAKQIAQCVQHVELAEKKGFQEVYLAAMGF